MAFNLYLNSVEVKSLKIYSKLPTPKDMRRTCVFRTCTTVLRQIFSIVEPEGWKAKACAQWFTDEFGHFWGTKKVLRKKTFFFQFFVFSFFFSFLFQSLYFLLFFFYFRLSKKKKKMKKKRKTFFPVEKQE